MKKLPFETDDDVERLDFILEEMKRDSCYDIALANYVLYYSQKDKEYKTVCNAGPSRNTIMSFDDGREAISFILNEVEEELKNLEKEK